MELLASTGLAQPGADRIRCIPGRIGAGARGRPQGFGAPIGGGDAEPRIRIRKRPGDRSSASHGAGGDPRHRHGRPTPAYESPDIPVSCAQNRIICAHLLPRTARFSGARIGDLCGLQLADHKLFITARHRHLPAASREMNHRLSRQTRHQRPVAGRSRDPRSPAYAYLTRRLPRGTARGTAFRIVPAHRELSVLRAVSSVLLVRTVNEAVLMVRRRSTVRFRNGAPGQRKFSNFSLSGDFKIK